MDRELKKRPMPDLPLYASSEEAKKEARARFAAALEKGIAEDDANAVQSHVLQSNAEGESIGNITEADEISAVTEDKKKPIGEKEISEALATFRKYQEGKKNLDERLRSNTEWWRLHGWNEVGGPKNPNDPTPSSAWLFNSIANKHADAMDNYPKPNILPRAKDDEEDAKVLSQIIPVLLEYNNFEDVYSRLWWKKLVGGSCCVGVFWNNDKFNGLGDVDIKVIDILKLFWEPGISDLQDSSNIFLVEMVDDEVLKNEYPFLKNVGGNPGLVEYTNEENIDKSDKSAVYDWYYKRNIGGKEILHYCKFVEGELIYASENEDEYKDGGYYTHGRYPFEIDYSFPCEDSPCGFGYVDNMKPQQMYIDKLKSLVLKNAMSLARQRYFVKGEESPINEEEFADMSKELVHVMNGSIDEKVIRAIDSAPLPPIVLQVLNQSIDELKETSGNRDFSQGATSSGVTSGSAIAALQEAGNKLSRDQIKSSYRFFGRMVYLCIELIRQFYTEPRTFRIIGAAGDTGWVDYDNSNIAPRSEISGFDMPDYTRVPIFDIKVSAQKTTVFSREIENERAKELYAAGFFNPQMSDQALAALEMMDFEGIDKVRDKISQNGTMFAQIQQLQTQVIQLAQIIKLMKGERSEEYTDVKEQQPMPLSSSAEGKNVESSGLGEVIDRTNAHQAEAMRRKVQAGATPT